MATLTLSIPDDLLQRAMARFDKKPKAHVQEYLIGALETLTADGEPIDDETEAKLLEGLDSPARKMTDADWRALMKRATKRRKR